MIEEVLLIAPVIQMPGAVQKVRLYPQEDEVLKVKWNTIRKTT